MDDRSDAKNEQAPLWNGPAGQAWVEAQGLLDRLFQPFEALLVEAAASCVGGRVLDVGCGTGGTTLAIAAALGPAGEAVGIDLSAPMIALARARAAATKARASFVHADAQRHAFAPAGFDRVVSRFGVMFFDDPVRAFTGLRQAARPGAGLDAIAWRGVDENPFMTTAERAAAPLLPGLPARRPGAPGQFAFADAARVRAILERSGWRAIDIRPIDVACTLGEADLMPYATRLGPVGLALQQADARTRDRVTEALHAAFASSVDAGAARFTAACWRIGATA